MKKTTFILLVTLLNIVGLNLKAIQTTVESGGDIQAAITAAANGDTLVLVDGGTYTGTEIVISKTIMIKALNGASVRPKITLTTGFSPSGKGNSFELKGIEVDGSSSASNHMITIKTAGDSIPYIRLTDIVAHSFGRTILRMDKGPSPQSYLDSLFIDNCHFYNFNAGGWNGFYWRDERVKTKFFSLTNTTLDGFNEGIIRFDGITFVKKIYVDRCTFNNRSTYNGTKDANPLLDINGPAGSVFKMTNCIISDIDSITVPAIGIDAAVADTIMNCRFFFDQTAVDTTHTWDYKSQFIKADPQYADAANNDLSLPRSSSFLTAATDGGPIGDPRWVPAPLPSGLVAWWKFDETAGTVAEDEAELSDGIYKNTGDSLWVTGVVGNAFNFGAGSDSAHVLVPDNSTIDFDSTTSFSVSALVKIADISSSNDLDIVFKGATGKNTPDEKGHFYGMMFKNNELRFVVDDDVTKSQLGYPSANLAMKMNGWNHIVGVRDVSKDTLYIYLNGTMVASMLDNTNRNITSGPLPLIIGNNQGHNLNFGGMIDEILMYNKALSAAEILEMTTVYDLLREPSSDSTLSDLKVTEVTVSGFSAQVTSYSAELPYGTTIVPTVTATATSKYANVQITNAAQLPGTTTVTVTAEDGSILVYSVTFTIAAPSTDATLSDIKVNGTTVAGFSSATTSYNIELPEGTTAVPAVLATTTHSSATAVITNATALPGTTSILVTAQDGTTASTYSVAFTVSVGIDNPAASLISVYFNRNSNELVVNNIPGNTKIEVFSADGKLLFFEDKIVSDLYKLSGNYLSGQALCIVRLTSENHEVRTFKIVK